MLWFFRYKIPFAVDPSRAEASLARTLERDHAKAIVVKRRKTRLLLYSTPPALIQNAWNPIFDCVFQKTESGAVLVGYFRINWPVFGFSLVWVGIVLAEVFHTWSMPDSLSGHVADWKHARLAADLGLLGVMLLITLCGWALGIGSQKRILSAIKKSAETA
jgi:hypothetical protein